MADIGQLMSSGTSWWQMSEQGRPASHHLPPSPTINEDVAKTAACTLISATKPILLYGVTQKKITRLH
jgi:hypothetical protein